MEVKSYRAPTIQDALRLVQQDLGPDAAVLQTRQVWDGLWRGLLGGRQVEVTASNTVHIPSRFDGSSGVADARREAPRPAALDTAYPTVPPAHHEDYRAKFRADLRGSMGDWGSWIDDLRRDEGRAKELPQALFNLFTDLVDTDVDEDLARELVARICEEATEQQQPEQLRQLALQMIESEFSIQGPIQVAAGSGRVVALVGPTGVGKTTTIAKLAANFRLREKRRVGLITVDTYRIAAVEQLRTYADIIDLPMEVVSTAREMREAVNRLSNLDLILMDTAGRSPRDEIRIRELKSILAEAQAHEVHLVLSATASPSALRKTAERFADVGTTALLITKLDESTGLGNLMPLWRSCTLPMSYVTNGQNVPDDIQPAHARQLAMAILGPSW